MSLKNVLKKSNSRLISTMVSFYKMLKSIYCSYIKIGIKKNYSFRAATAIVNPPCIFDPSLVEIYDQARISSGFRLISYRGKFIVKKYSVVAADCTAVTQNHKSTVTIPHSWLGINHINDDESDIVVEEDVWVGCGVTLLKGAHLGRGCICASRSLINKEIPPYAVVAGVPAKIIAVKFSKEQILRHEQKLYSEKERLSIVEIENLFEKYYEDKKVFGTDFLSESDSKIIAEYKERNGIDYIQ